MTVPGRMEADHLGRDQPGGEDAADERGGDHHVRLSHLGGQDLPLPGLVLVGQLLGVAPACRGALR